MFFAVSSEYVFSAGAMFSLENFRILLYAKMASTV